MSAMESFIWTAGAWASGPAIIIGGLAVTALVFCFLMEKSGND